MAVTAADITEHLAQVNAAIAWLLGAAGTGAAGAPTAEFWEGGDRWRGVPIEVLFEERDRLQTKLSKLETSGASFSFVEVPDA